MKIKICGLKRPEDIDAVNQATPDYAGFVFAPNSKRYVPYPVAASLRKELNPRIQSVGVFVNAPVEDMARLVREGVIDVVQLHGREDQAVVSRLRSIIKAPVIQAFGIRTAEDIRKAEKTTADFCLLDTQKNNVFGGTGEAFDWSVIGPMKKPFFLAGGLGEENIYEAMRVSPFCLDISSSVEMNGYKDAGKIKRIVTMIRECGA